MKLHRLELTGFGPFRERQLVDFDAFDADGVFLIAGRTGAGKSSILDGVSFALYGSVPRYDGGERRLRSDHCGLEDPTEVRVEFTVGDSRWRVTRSPDYERPAKRGGGTTVEPAHVEVAEFVDGQWVGRAARAREAGELLDGILGVNAQQFQQVILLAQNKFSRFLLASNVERQALLRTLFGTRRFERYRDEFEARKRDAARAVDRAGERVRTLFDEAEHAMAAAALGGDDEPGEDLTERRHAIERAERRAAYRAETATDEARRAAETASRAIAGHQTALAQAQTLTDLERHRAALADLSAQTDRIDADRSRAAAADAAEVLRAPVETAARAESDRASAVRAAQTLRLQWDAAEAGADPVEVDERLAGQIAVWEAVLAREAALPAREAHLARQETAIAEIEAQRASAAEQRAAFPQQRERLDAERQQALAAAAPCDALRAERERLSAQRGASERASALAAAAETAQARHTDAVAAAVAASTAVTTLLQRRLAGYAGELATSLVAGEPCAVCGATAHPRPAAAHPDPVTDDDLADAERARDVAASREKDAAAAARTARDDAADAAAASGGASVEELDRDRARLDADLGTAQAATARAADLERHLAEVDELASRAAAEDEKRAEILAAAREERAALAATVSAARAAVDEARGEHATVAERVAQSTAMRDLARRLTAAADREAESQRALDLAEDDLATRLQPSAFADAAAVVAALLEEDERARLRERVSAHAEHLAAAKARLLELELAVTGFDADRVDVAAAADARTAAETARETAVSAQHSAEHTAAALRTLVQRIDDAAGAADGVGQEAAAVIRLADTVAGRPPNTKKMDLETFVLAAELEEIVAAANLRLSDMSAGRYSLHHSDALAARGAASGLGIEVLDAHTGRRRPPQSLSGGETFLASLALALGLAEVVTSRAGGIRLDTLFIDEGFGSLDPETLDLAMRTLDELRAGGRTVGVISHVESMKEQIPAPVSVSTVAGGASSITQEVVAHGGAA
ncbi:AAA family ATPase [Microbacterium sp.]|uniref:AAA family ATPase n=1 Tax=Microbacterium sp. TaxID=51671 RepID=UPI003A86CBC3